MNWAGLLFQFGVVALMLALAILCGSIAVTVEPISLSALAVRVVLGLASFGLACMALSIAVLR